MRIVAPVPLWAYLLVGAMAIGLAGAVGLFILTLVGVIWYLRCLYKWPVETIGFTLVVLSLNVLVRWPRVGLWLLAGGVIWWLLRRKPKDNPPVLRLPAE